MPDQEIVYVHYPYRMELRLDQLGGGLLWERDAIGLRQEVPATEEWAKGFLAMSRGRQTLLTLAMLTTVCAYETYEFFRGGVPAISPAVRPKARRLRPWTGKSVPSGRGLRMRRSAR